MLELRGVLELGSEVGDPRRMCPAMSMPTMPPTMTGLPAAREANLRVTVGAEGILRAVVGAVMRTRASLMMPLPITFVQPNAACD